MKNRMPHHTSKKRGTWSNDWGTPKDLVEEVRRMYGRIDFDLASSAEHNKIIRAKKYWTAQDPCPERPDLFGEETPDPVVWCNPPGPLLNVGKFWAIWLWCVSVSCRGAFLIYNMDHWRCLPAPPEDMCVVVLHKRLRFVGAKSGASFPSALVLSRDPVWNADLGHCVVWNNTIWG